MSARAETFIIDPSHSTVSFKVKGPIGKVKGKFEKFEGQFDYESNQPQQWNTTATVETASILTGIKKRDSDLKGLDFLNVKTYPTMTFTSTGAAQPSTEKAQISGNLTIRGVTHPVVLVLESVEVLHDASGQRRAHAVASTRIDRKEFDVGATHGTFMVGKIVEIHLDIQGMPKHML